jgi:hypothetical protein
MVLTSIIIELEKLQENKLELKTMWEPTSGANFYGVNRKILRSSNLEIMFYGFPNEKKHVWANSKKMVSSIQGIILLTQ